MKTLDIFYLTNRRPKFLLAHALELSEAIKEEHRVRSVVFLGNPNSIPQTIKDSIRELLKEQIIIEDHYGNDDYMGKLNRIASSDADYVMKIDEDCYMTSESWRRMIALIEEIRDDDLFATGCITNGVPTCDLFLQYHTPNIKDRIETDYFCKTNFHPINGADYRVLNHPSLKMRWNPDFFWYLVSTINHPYQGIHPMRMRFDANVILNDYILDNFNASMLPKDIPVIHEKTKYPHYCPQVLLMEPTKLVKVLGSKELYFDSYEEVPLNFYREKNQLAMAIAPGIPILHTMFNWSQQYDYENKLIDDLVGVSKRRHQTHKGEE